jgi:hypothetical protein
MFTTDWHGCAHGNLRARAGQDLEHAMHQASILFTFAVMAMAGAWYVMQDMRRSEAAETPAQTASISASVSVLAE